MAAKPRGLRQTLATLAIAGVMVSAPADAKTGIDRVLIVSETTDSAMLEVHYTYDGTRRAMMQASSLAGSAVSQHSATTAGAVRPGQHRTRVQVTRKAGAPKLFTTDALRLMLKVRGSTKPAASRTVVFAKTWAAAGTALQPKRLLVAQVVARAPNRAAATGQSPLRATVTPPRTRLDLFAAAKKSGQVGQIGGFKTPSGTTVVYSHAQPATPPDSAPDMQHELWARGEADRLLGIIASLLGNDSGALNWYKSTEAGDASPYGQISKRAEAIAVMVAEEK